MTEVTNQIYTNGKKIPLALAVFLATDHYDFDPDTLSATAIIKPIRQSILKRRVPVERQLTDIDSLIQSRVGTSIHDGIEKAWTGNYRYAMAQLGYPKEIIDRIKINPDPEQLAPEDVPVYMEQRHYRNIEVGGKTFRISGKMDFIADGVVQDYKSTIAFTYKHGTKLEDFKLQGSIYRWLAPHIITGDYIFIHYIFMDWAKYKVKSEENYPPSRCVSDKIDLLTLEETEAYIRDKLSALLAQQDLPEEEITRCTDKELWREDDVWKYFKNPKNAGVAGKRSTANFPPSKGGAQAAHARYVKDGSVGTVIHRKGQVKACKYCAGFHACTQKDEYIADKTLTFDDELA